MLPEAKDGNEDGKEQELNNGAPETPHEPSAEDVGHVDGVPAANFNAPIDCKLCSCFLREPWGVQSVDVVCVGGVWICVGVNTEVDDKDGIENGAKTHRNYRCHQ